MSASVKFRDSLYGFLSLESRLISFQRSRKMHIGDDVLDFYFQHITTHCFPLLCWVLGHRLSDFHGLRRHKITPRAHMASIVHVGTSGKSKPSRASIKSDGSIDGGKGIRALIPLYTHPTVPPPTWSLTISLMGHSSHRKNEQNFPLFLLLRNGGSKGSVWPHQASAGHDEEEIRSQPAWGAWGSLELEQGWIHGTRCP